MTVDGYGCGLVYMYTGPNFHICWYSTHLYSLDITAIARVVVVSPETMTG